MFIVNTMSRNARLSSNQKRAKLPSTVEVRLRYPTTGAEPTATFKESR